jgi:VIT1/CCC1 family predicted Fe2+/Mn2+ transporter/rubrerythrin
MSNPPQSNPMKTRELLAHWQDELESALIYDHLAETEPDPQRAELYRELARVERMHQELFAKLLRRARRRATPASAEFAHALPPVATTSGNRRAVLQARIHEESREVQNYLRHRARLPLPIAQLTTQIARDEAQHISQLSALLGQQGEPWHRIESGGFLRNVVYGFNDGLTANFGLVMGVIGAEFAPQAVLLSGLAGLIADALSMGASGYLAAKSEREVYEHEIQMEHRELELMPELEEQELALLYEAKGMSREAAQEAARRVMADPERALQEKVREELGIGQFHSSPLREGLLTGAATALGALVPVIPFFFGHSSLIIWLSFSISMLMHFVVGAARSVFTGRDFFRSGLDMFLVGLGVAIVGYLAGDLLMRLL